MVKKRAKTKKQIETGRLGLPTREQLLTYISENPGRAGKREIARAFGVKGDDRMALKKMIRALEVEGLVNKSGKRLIRPGELPSVTVLDVLTRDRDGGLLAKPTQWDDSNGKTPLIRINTNAPARSGKKTGPVPGVGDQVLARVNLEEKNKGGDVYTARVMKILEKRPEAVLGVFRKGKDGGARIEPVERRQSEMEVHHDHFGEAKDGDLVEVQVSKSGRYGLQRAKVINVLGSLTSEKAVSMIAIHAHNIPHVFPQNVMDEAEAAKSAEIDKKREDWRELPLLTIDPADAKDHDDAIYAEADSDSENNPGGHIVYVAIADVSWYVRHGMAMDDEAVKRGNSVYFPDRVVPMLPERISNDLCSLREGVERPALAVKMRFNANGKKIGHTFHRIMMKSHVRLSYQEAQTAIDGIPNARTKPHLKPILEPLWEAYRCLTRGRNNRQPLELDLPERKILIDKDGNVDRVIVPPRLDAHKLVEECMIQANVAAAETLEEKRQALIYRIHDAPSLAKLESLRDFLKTLNIALIKGTKLRPSHFNGILSEVKGTDHEALANSVVLRSQSQAEYNPENIGHFGLNLQKYAHFTSPIRRYADLIVHRALVAALGLGEGGLKSEEISRLDVIAQEISDTERRAMAAERDTVDRLIAAHLAEKIGATFSARINGTTKAGLFVTLDDTGADGFVPISTLGDEYFIYDEVSHALIGENSATGYQMGDQVEVKLAEAAPLAGSLRFEMISEGRKTNALLRSRRTNSRPGRSRAGSVSGRAKPAYRTKRGGKKRS